ncbi:MAG TPA: Kazal-type serine protease inhibitor [Sandaracinaceae bacterium LLY-WYZ-13_1]|nr:Kazal-type serine protease inhibitor [Sandaracinaceae bacterium LLY-WYZ-13_1]
MKRVTLTTSLWLALLVPPVAAQAQTTAIGPIEADRARIRAHLAEVEAELRAVDTSHLDLTQRRARARAIDLLHDYWVAGRFPHNTQRPRERVPVFIDADGRRCAMAHLVMETGGEEAARAIASTQNLARVTDMESEALGAWLEANGMTLREAQRVQPAYCMCPEGGNPVCGADGNTYRNRCVVDECSRTELAYEGPCTDAGPGGGDPPEATDGGCSVSAGRTGGASGLVVLGLVLALVLRRRPRR